MFGTSGAIVCYGKSGSGKTDFIKKIIEQQIQLHVVKPENVHILTRSMNDKWPYDTHHEWGDIIDIRKKIKAKCCPMGEIKENSIIVVDDFNNEGGLNTSTDPEYNGLFTRGRHEGIRMITVAHSAKSIGPTAREQIKYGVIFKTNVKETITQLGDLFLGYDAHKMNGMLKGLDLEHKALVIDVGKNKHSYAMAEDILIKGQDKVMDTSFNMANKNVMNSGEYNDNSSTNVQINMKTEIQQMIQQQTMSQKIQTMEYDFQIEMKKKKMEEGVKEIILKRYKTLDDKHKIIFVLNYLSGTNMINEKNRITAQKMFMKQKGYNVVDIEENKSSAIALNLLTGKETIYNAGLNIISSMIDI